MTLRARTPEPESPDPASREHLILDHVPLLKHVVGKLSLDLPASIDRDDLIGFGMLGLIAAADSWEPERGLAFSTYAYTRIRGAVLDELRRQDFLPRSRREKVRQLDRVVAQVEQETGLPPSIEQLAERLGVEIEDVDRLLSSARTAHLASLDVSDGCELGDLLSDPASLDPVGSAEWHETRALLASAIRELDENEQTVVNLYYAEDLLLREISELLGLSESRISQIHARALYRLNHSLTAALGNQAA